MRNRTLPPSAVVVRSVALAVVACVAGIVLLLGSGDHHYDLKLRLANAAGLRPGSQVLLGGVPVGTVASLKVGAGDDVVADLQLKDGTTRIGRGASAQIIAANLLGEHYVSLKPGDPHAPLPSGTSLPPSRTAPPTDLDQLVDVLDDPTRANLQILLNEAGIAVGGRRKDVAAILRQLPLSMESATTLLRELVQDNHTLRDAVADADRFVGRMNAGRADLRRLIDSAAGAATSVARHSEDLRRSVAGAPATLRTLQAFLAGGATTARELTPAAARLADTAPALHRLLAAVGPFTGAAVPTLDRAAAVAPALSTLGVRATPTVRRAVPAAAALEKTAGLARPLSAWVGLAAPDIWGVPNGWSRAIQFRDGISHVFNGELFLNPKVVLNFANRGASAAQRRRNLLDVKSTALLRTMGLYDDALRARREQAAAKRAPARPALSAAPKLPLRLPSLIPQATPPSSPPPAPRAPGPGTSGVQQLLAHLLGA